MIHMRPRPRCERTRVRPCMLARRPASRGCAGMPNLRAKILDCRGFDSSTILMLRGGILMSIGEFPESLSQAILAGIILVGRSGRTGLFAVRSLPDGAHSQCPPLRERVSRRAAGREYRSRARETITFVCQGRLDQLR